MKISKTLKRFVFVPVAAAACIAGMTDPAAARDDTLVSIDVLQDDAESIVLHFEFEDFLQKPVHVNGDLYTSILLGKESLKMEAGAPALPDVTRSVIIPNMGSMEVVLLDGDFIEINDIDIAPSKGNILRTTDPATVPWSFGPVYKTDEFWPAEPVTAREPYILRSKRGLAVTVNPFQYNPVTKTLRVYSNMTVAVDNVGMGRVNLLMDANKHDGGSAFHKIYSTQFVNYHGESRSYPIAEEGSMLIIAADQFVPNVQPLADHKNSIGLDTTLVAKSDIGSSWSDIDSYIAAMYAGSDLVYVLLVGDSDSMPAPTSSGGLSDPSYSKRAGSDNYPDIIVGRFSANTAAHVDIQVEKTIAYEAEQFTQKDEFGPALGIASNQGPGDDNETDDQHVENIGTKLLEFVHTQWYSEYDPSGSVADAVNAINNGVGIIQYTGHGYQSGWGNGAALTNGDVNGLTNTTMWPFIVSVACVVGEYNSGDCFCEVWQRASHNGQPTGSIAHYGSTINQSWSPPMSGQDAMVDYYVGEEYFTFGAMCFMGSCIMMDEYGSSGVTEFDTWTIFGDPSVIVSGTAQPPTGMRVSGSNLVAEGPSGGPFSPSSTTYTIENNEDYSIDYQVLEDASWLDIVGSGTGTLPPQGSIELTLNINGSADSFSNGFYEASIEFANLYNNDGNVVKPATLTVGTPQPVYAWDLSEDPGWSMQGEWGFGQPTGGGGGSFGLPDPTSGATDNYVLGVNLNGDYSTNVGGPYYLTSEAFDCSNLTETSVSFMRWLNTDYQPYVSASIEASSDGANWSTLWENGSSGEITANSWSEHEFDISALADGEAYVQVRWTYEVTSGAWAYSGWNIDDVVVSAVDSSSPPCSGDINGDGDVGVDDLLAVIAGWQDPYTVDDLLNVIGGWGDCDQG